MPALPSFDKKTAPPLPGLPGTVPGGDFHSSRPTAKKTVVFANNDDEDDSGFNIVSKP